MGEGARHSERRRAPARRGDGRPDSPTDELGQLEIDGDTSISISDIYDAPLCVILNLCSHFWERRRDQPAGAPVPAGAGRSS